MSALRPYHQFLGNGIDAVLLGRTGGMSAEAAQGLDRCYWYKSDVYYGDERRFEPGDDPLAFLAAPPGGTNFQLAPLGRAWFEVLDGEGSAERLLDSAQAFSVRTGVLHTSARYPGVEVEVQTALADGVPALIFDLQANVELTVLAYVAPGLWPEDAEQVEPAEGRVPLDGPMPGWRYRVGTHTCTLFLVPAVATCSAGMDGRGAWLHLSGRHVRWWAVLESGRYPTEQGAWRRLPADVPGVLRGDEGGLNPAAGRAHDPLPGLKTGASWSATLAQGDIHRGAEGGASIARPADDMREGMAGGIEVPDPDYQRLHDFSMYMFRAIQNRYSGGLPVNNLRRTFNSHVFWDGAFVQRALLEAGQVGPAREAWRFLGRTRAAAAANARATFDVEGLHWDWETTHRGERAYVPWLQQRFQVHNTPLLAHMIMADYLATRDLWVLDEGYDLLAGAATFLLQAVLVEEGGRLVTRPLVGSHEAPTPVVDDGATVAASLRLLQDVALASRLLGRDAQFGRRCAVAARMLRPTLAALFNGRYFQASRDEDRLNTSSLAPIYPADVVAPGDPRARSTAVAYRALYAGRMAGHGNDEQGFPWSAGVLARILAYQGRAEAAWEQLDLARPALCAQGGCAEYVGLDGHWNAQYFSTAQAALCSALHAMLLQAHGAELRLFPSLPPHWDRCGFGGFLVHGLGVDGQYQRGRATVTVRNATDRLRVVRVRLGGQSQQIVLSAGAQRTLELGGSDDRA